MSIHLRGAGSPGGLLKSDADFPVSLTPTDSAHLEFIFLFTSLTNPAAMSLQAVLRNHCHPTGVFSNTWQYTQKQETECTPQNSVPWIHLSKCSLVTWETIPLKLPRRVAPCSRTRRVSDNRDQPAATQTAPQETVCNKIPVCETQTASHIKNM